ncbi:hypothetical protein FOXB_02659 [Fusarium oxysporum f. sp. conglutinans Fo5176]|uniref:Reverse transcriptase Ty1/copia-type domain-containing protein n=1 Tax=Fusarium oxysporum (strain Fo5176) TaxID=660025 RepID=F9F8D4_FUSOF|nr:hypothetical protein FOXB_02659 [Fusarium oxysporum f. sp. conglutinans Fo5176]
MSDQRPSQRRRVVSEEDSDAENLIVLEPSPLRIASREANRSGETGRGETTPDEPHDVDQSEPRTFREATQGVHGKLWWGGLKDEYGSLVENGVWTLVTLPPGRKALRGKWVFKRKRGENGQVLRYKARFVVRGFEQREGIDFNETFASVVKPMSYKMIFAIADTAGESPQASESSSSVASRKRFRTPTATDIWTVSRQSSSKEPERNRHGQKIWYCKRCAYSHTAHNRVRGHLRDKHYIQISEKPTAKKLGQNNAIDRLFRLQAARQEGHDIEQEKHLLAAVDEGFQLHGPRVVTQSRGQVPKLLEEGFTTHRQTLITKLKFSLAQVHFSIDIWSSPNYHSLLAIVAHFINLDSRQLYSALLALRELEGAHSGEAIAETLLRVINSYGIQDKIGYITFDNAYNNDTMLQAVAKACGFNAAHRRLCCNGHVINLAVQAFLFGKNKDVSDEALRQVSQLSYDEQEGAVERAETATTWRQYGALGMLHNLVQRWWYGYAHQVNAIRRS